MEDRLNRLLLAALAGILTSAALAQTDPAGVVLTVNGDTVKAAEYFHRMEILPGVTKRAGNSTLSYPPGFLTIEALITERLVFQLAKQKGVMPTDAEVQAELTSILADTPTFLTDAALVGQSRADVEQQLKYQMAQFKISTFGVTITDAEIDRFYKDKGNLFLVPKRAKLSVIAVSDEAMKSKVDADLDAGKPFSEVAKTYSEDVSKASGGEFGTVPINELPEQVRTELAKVKIGQRTAWVVMPQTNTQAKFLLQDIVPEKMMALDAKLRKQIRRRLMLDRGSVRNDIGKEMGDMRAKAKIDIANKSFAEMYKKYLDDLGKAGG